MGSRPPSTPAENGKDKADKAKQSGDGGGEEEARKAKQAAKKAAKEAKKAKNKAAAPAPDPKSGGGGGGGEEELVTKLDMRLGVIIKAWEHPDSDKLWCEEIDIGEEKPRLIASGLRHFYANESDLTGRKVLVLANLKARPLGGFKSEGMVLCASNKAHDVVKFVEVPADAPVGEAVHFDGLEGAPATPAQIAKKKILEKVLPLLVTGDGGRCTYKGEKDFLLDSGPCTAPVEAGFVIS